MTESLNGEYVKPFGEKAIANALFEHAIEYQYERNHRWSGVNYRPDFTIRTGPNRGVVIEYFGLAGDADYDEMSERKRRYWAERDGWTFIEFSPADLLASGVEGFVQHLLEELRKAGVSYRRRSEEEISELARTRALDGFTTAMRTFVGRCRKRNLTPDDLAELVEGHTPCSTAEGLFLDVGISIYRSYLQWLVARNKEDFDGLMWQAVSMVHEGLTRFMRDRGRERGDLVQFRFVLIDEFQDFSQMFFELANAIRLTNLGAQFFCVGDDWQAINGFAGSDLRFFSDFAAYFIDTSQCHIRTNYRSPQSVVEVGNALMNGRGPTAQAVKAETGLVWLCKLDQFNPSAPERKRHNGDEITPAVLRLVRHFLDCGQRVVMLSRRNGIPWYVNYPRVTMGAANTLERFLEHVRSFLPEDDRERVTISTAHKYKGLEQQAIIVLDAVQRSYPLIHPNWVFLRIFGDSIAQIEADERRLFYVAITRAEHSLALLTERPRESPYLADIQRHVHLTSLSWDTLPPAPSLDGARLEIRIFDAYDVKDELKSIGYVFQAIGKYWHKDMMAEGFSIESLLGQPWARGRVRIEVYSEAGDLLHRCWPA